MGGLRGATIVNKNFVNKLAFPKCYGGSKTLRLSVRLHTTIFSAIAFLVQKGPLGGTKLAISAASYRGAKCPTLKTAGKTAENGAEWVTVKQPRNSRENTRNTRKTVKTAVFRVFRVFFRLFFGCFTVTHSAPFSAVFPAVFNVGHLAHL